MDFRVRGLELDKSRLLGISEIANPYIHPKYASLNFAYPKNTLQAPLLSFQLSDPKSAIVRRAAIFRYELADCLRDGLGAKVLIQEEYVHRLHCQEALLRELPF